MCYAHVARVQTSSSSSFNCAYSTHAFKLSQKFQIYVRNKENTLIGLSFYRYINIYFVEILASHQTRVKGRC